MNSPSPAERKTTRCPSIPTVALIGGLLFFGCVGGSVLAAAPAGPRLSKKQDTFFIENDFVYRRFLQLARDGSYRQMIRDRTASSEVDEGTWEQTSDGTVLLHYTRGGLRFHALLSGPLSLRLDAPEKVSALPSAASEIRRWLAQSSDVAFAASSLRELTVAPLALTLDLPAESFRRDDLEALARQIDDFVWCEQHRTHRLILSKPPGLPLLMIQSGAVFTVNDVPRVQREYRGPRGQPPPFYFAQVDAGTFAREAGSWQKLR